MGAAADRPAIEQPHGRCPDGGAAIDAELDPRYGVALLDWLACASAGRDQPAARAAAAGDEDPILAVATAGHVLDFDDTYLPGLAHLSAPTAPVALVAAARLGATLGEALAAYARGFEAIGALARASHPALYDRGWHPTAVCGGAGAAVTAATLLGLDAERERTAVGLALLAAGGLRAAFGSDAKALQVGFAAATGARAARLAAAGASVSAGLPEAFAGAYGGRWAEPDPGRPPAIAENWIKAHPCCLQTHGAIEAAAAARAGGLDPGARVVVVVHPVSRQAAPLDDVATGLQAKFSIPYVTAFALAHGPPGVADFARVDPGARARARSISVRVDPRLAESEAILEADGGRVARIEAARGSPRRPLTEPELRDKRRTLVGARLDGVLDDPARPARDVLAAAGLAGDQDTRTREPARS